MPPPSKIMRVIQQPLPPPLALVHAHEINLNNCMERIFRLPFQGNKRNKKIWHKILSHGSRWICFPATSQINKPVADEFSSEWEREYECAPLACCPKGMKPLDILV